MIPLICFRNLLDCKVSRDTFKGRSSAVKDWNQRHADFRHPLYWRTVNHNFHPAGPFRERVFAQFVGDKDMFHKELDVFALVGKRLLPVNIIPEMRVNKARSSQEGPEAYSFPGRNRRPLNETPSPESPVKCCHAIGSALKSLKKDL